MSREIEKKITKAMEKAALALLDAKCYGDTFAFPGKHENGCWSLKYEGLAETHPKGLQVYSRTADTLTSQGQVTGRQAFCLTPKGQEFASSLAALRAVGGEGGRNDARHYALDAGRTTDG